MNPQEFKQTNDNYQKTGFPGICEMRGDRCGPLFWATKCVFWSEKEIGIYCDNHAPKGAVLLHPPEIKMSVILGAPSVAASAVADNSDAATVAAADPSLTVANLRSRLGGQFGIRLQSTGATPDVELTRIILQTIGASPATPYLVKLDQLILDPFTGTDVGATGVLTSDNTNVANNDTVTIGTKVYTFKTTLTPTEGEVLRGGSADASLLNLIRAINHTGTPNTDYKCAAAHPAVNAASSVTAHAFQVTGIAPGVSTVATTETSAHLSWGAATLAGGSRAGKFDLVERDARRRVFDGTSAGGTAVLASATMNFQTSDVDKIIRVGINPGRLYRILSRQSATQVTLSGNITLPSVGLILTMDGTDESEVTIATKDGFTAGATDAAGSRLPKVLTVDKTYSVVFVPGTAGDGLYSINVQGLNGGR